MLIMIQSVQGSLTFPKAWCRLLLAQGHVPSPHLDLFSPIGDTKLQSVEEEEYVYSIRVGFH